MADEPPGALRGFPPQERARVVGILNVTPDSFSDGGAYLDTESAVRHGFALSAQGADLVDVGGESTRPGAARVPLDVELSRVIPVVTALAKRGVAVSIDTTRAEVAAQALDAGAQVVNDVSGGNADPDMYRLVADRRVPYVLMHSRGPSIDMTARASYADVVHDVRDELRARLDAAVAAGVSPDQVVLDPGIGFHKIGPQNWALLANIDVLAGLGRPLLVGTSRKAFLGNLLAEGGEVRPPTARDAATHATTALLAAAGVWGVRVHEIAPTLDAVRVGAAWAAARTEHGS